MRKNGFTMIEFMVVIALIGILAVLAVGNYSKSLKRGRDAGRIADMKEVQKTFEQYFSLNNKYFDTNCAAMFTDQTGSNPGDPDYFGTCTVTEYTYCAELELPEDYGNANCLTLGDASSCSMTTDKTTANSYCVKSVQ